MKEPKWLRLEAVIALHDEQISRHGGLFGIRDENLLESALARSQNLFAYGRPSIFELAATLGFGLAKNHPFNDANKRTAYGSCVSFLRLNNYKIIAESAEKIAVVVALAEDKITEKEFAIWLENNCVQNNHVKSGNT